MRSLSSFVRVLSLAMIIETLLVFLVPSGSWAETEVVSSSYLNTTEFMAKIQASLPERIRVIGELKIQAPPQKVGEQRRFYHPIYSVKKDREALTTLEGKSEFNISVTYIEARCVKIIKKIAYIYIEVGYDDKFEREAKDIASIFSKEKKRLIKFLGPPAFDVDADPAIYFIISPTAFSHHKPSISAKVSLTDTDLSFPNSNGAEIIYIKPYSFGGVDIREYMGFEYTHILSISHDWEDEIWMHEGLGYASARILGYKIWVTHQAALDEFLSWKGSAEDNISVCYFFLFIYDQYGLEAVRRILTDPRDGKDSISYVVGKSWNELWSEYQMFMKRGPVFTRQPP